MRRFGLTDCASGIFKYYIDCLRNDQYAIFKLQISRCIFGIKFRIDAYIGLSPNILKAIIFVASFSPKLIFLGKLQKNA